MRNEVSIKEIFKHLPIDISESGNDLEDKISFLTIGINLPIIPRHARFLKSLLKIADYHITLILKNRANRT